MFVTVTQRILLLLLNQLKGLWKKIHNWPIINQTNFKCEQMGKEQMAEIDRI